MKKIKYYLFAAIASIILFLLFYGLFLFMPFFQPSSNMLFMFSFFYKYLGYIGLFFILSLIFINFIFLMNYTKGDKGWRTKGVYIAFIISLFGEMYGSALIAYLLSPFFKYPILVDYYHSSAFRDSIYGLSLSFVLLGLIIIVIGWKKLYYSKGLVTDGIYKYIRHPQYLGFILVIIGWILIWPTLIILILFPIYIFIYIYQAYKEDKMLLKEYGQKFIDYKNKTGMLLPKIKKA